MSSLEDFKLNELIAKGAYGEVHRVVGSNGNWYALKIMPRSKVNDADIKREGRIHIRLNHQNVLKMWRFFIDDNKVTMVLAYMSRGTVSDFINKKGSRLTEDEAKILVRQLSAGVCYIHGEGVVHRDIKPDNLLMDRYRTLKISDFGTAGEVVDGKPLTGLYGSRFYMSPEVKAIQPHSFPADQWSVGVTILGMLHPPVEFQFQDATEMAAYIPVGSSPYLRDLVLSLLRVDPDARLTAPQVDVHPWLAL